MALVVATPWRWQEVFVSHSVCHSSLVRRRDIQPRHCTLRYLAIAALAFVLLDGDTIGL